MISGLLCPPCYGFSDAIELQNLFASQVITEGDVYNPSFIAGVDVSIDKDRQKGRAAAVVIKYPEMVIAEISIHTGKVPFPYVPGLLSFRELPLIIPAIAKLILQPDLILVDGHGLAHPRRLGIASHLGLCVPVPVIGCAKSRLCGEYLEPSVAAGSQSDLTCNGQKVGAVLRTRTAVKPVFVSPGNCIGFDQSVKWVMATCSGYRLPEPIRQAHIAAGSPPAGYLNQIVCHQE